MKKKYWCLIAALLIALIIISAVVYLKLKNKTIEIPSENGTIEVYFCPKDNCEQQIIDRMNNASIIHCAFYDLDLVNVINALNNTKLILDYDNKIDYLSARYDNRQAYMHNKFCIFDNNKIMTGSTNPTIKGVTKNNNNLIFITSKYLAENYEDEFDSMWNNNFGYDEEVKFPKIIFNNFTMENYFCPEDNCEQHIIETLQSANESIYFMTFSFTSDKIGDLLLEKSKSIEIKGIFEKQQNSKWSQYNKLKEFSTFAETPGKMHHKVFIIDKKIVITGSMNPSKNGNENNDENILIIHDEEVAELYLQEFYEILNNSL